MPRPADPAMRLKLVEVAAELLSEHGRDALTVRRLAREVGTSTQAVYTYFDGVDGLLVELWREGFERFGVALDEPAVTDDPVADLIAQGWGYRRFALRNPHLYRAMFGEGLLEVRHSDRSNPAAAGTTFFSLLTRLERCRDGGRFEIDDLFTAGEVVWASSHGHALIELSGYFDGMGRDGAATWQACLLRLCIGFGDDPAMVEASITAGRRRARRADRQPARN